MHIHNELKIYQKTSSSLNFVYYKQIQQISRKKPFQIRRLASEMLRVFGGRGGDLKIHGSKSRKGRKLAIPGP